MATSLLTPIAVVTPDLRAAYVRRTLGKLDDLVGQLRDLTGSAEPVNAKDVLIEDIHVVQRQLAGEIDRLFAFI